MKKIGEGYFYNVYDIGNGRVLKKKKSSFRFFFFILFIHISHKKEGLQECIKANKILKDIPNVYHGILSRLKDKNIIGNPKFLNDINYEQDKVVIIKDLLKKTKEEDQKIMVEDFILLIKEFWKYGFDENVYKSTQNNGYNSKGELILVDFNEICFDKEETRKRIGKQPWLERWSYLDFSLPMRQYFKQRMSEEINSKNLDLLWNNRT